MFLTKLSNISINLMIGPISVIIAVIKGPEKSPKNPSEPLPMACYVRLIYLFLNRDFEAKYDNGKRAYDIKRIVMTIKIQNSVYHYRAPVKDPHKVSLYRTLSDEDCEDFYYYIEWLGLPRNNRTIVLPLSNHYYYQPEDFEETEIIVNLRCLNHIRNLKSFLRSIHSNLQPSCYFTGCFTDSNNRIMGKESINNMPGTGDNHNHNDIKASRASMLKEKLHRFIDPGNNIRLTKDSVKSILKDIGFIVLGMSDLNGKTYFCTQKRLKCE